MNDRIEFEIQLPGDDGKTVKSVDLPEEQYGVATQMQAIQNQVDNLAASVNEYHMKQDHFRLKQKELIDLLENDESEEKDGSKKDANSGVRQKTIKS